MGQFSIKISDTRRLVAKTFVARRPLSAPWLAGGGDAQLSTRVRGRA